MRASLENNFFFAEHWRFWLYKENARGLAHQFKEVIRLNLLKEKLPNEQ